LKQSGTDRFTGVVLGVFVSAVLALSNTATDDEVATTDLSVKNTLPVLHKRVAEVEYCEQLIFVDTPDFRSLETHSRESM